MPATPAFAPLTWFNAASTMCGGIPISAMPVAANGCWRLGLPDQYAADLAHIGEYARLAATPEGFDRYLEQYVLARRAA